jgi:hypothetical protein
MGYFSQFKLFIKILVQNNNFNIIKLLEPYPIYKGKNLQYCTNIYIFDFN